MISRWFRFLAVYLLIAQVAIGLLGEALHLASPEYVLQTVGTVVAAVARGPQAGGFLHRHGPTEPIHAHQFAFDGPRPPEGQRPVEGDPSELGHWRAALSLHGDHPLTLLSVISEVEESQTNSWWGPIEPEAGIDTITTASVQPAGRILSFAPTRGPPCRCV